MESYLWYLENVLGLKSVVWPPMPEAPAESMAELTGKLMAESEPHISQVLFINDRPWSHQSEELFQKMREAMKLSKEQIRILFASQISPAELQVAALAADKVVCFSKDIYDQLSVQPEDKFHTFSPEDLLIKPDLKKAAWDDLKRVMKSLGLL